MKLLDEAWEFSVFVHLTDEADAGTTALYDDTVLPVADDDALVDDDLEDPAPALPEPSLVVVGGSLRWCPGPGPGQDQVVGRPSRFRLVVDDPRGPVGGPADGVLSVPTGVLIVSDASLHPWRRVTVPAGDHEVRVSSTDGGHDVVHEIALRRVHPSRSR